MSLTTSLLGPYDDLSTTEKTIVSASIPPDAKERLFVDLVPRRGAVDKIIARQLYAIDAYFCKHPQILSLPDAMREEIVSNLLNEIVGFLDELDPKTLIPKKPTL